VEFEAPEPRAIFGSTGAGIKDAADVTSFVQDEVALRFSDVGIFPKHQHQD